MTKEELEIEAEEFLRCTVCGDNCHDICEEPCHRAEGVKKHFLASTESREKRIAELEKENTELKDDNKVMTDNYSKMEQKFYANLTKAKEIIKKYYTYNPSCKYYYEDIDKEAEQFLKEE